MDDIHGQLLPAFDSADQVSRVLFRRHLGVPTCAEFDESLEELLNRTRGWYRESGTPWAGARCWGIQRYVYDVIHLEGHSTLSDPVLARGLDRVGAHAMVVVGLTAGTAVHQHIDELSQQGRPEEAMFFNSYALATVEHRLAAIQTHLRTLFSTDGITVLPQYTAGYDGWNNVERRRLLRLLQCGSISEELPLKLNASGELLPPTSALAVFGLTRRTSFDESLDQYWTCRVGAGTANGLGPRYAFPERALRRWSDERLKIKALTDGRLAATFRFDGTTCSNMGMPLAFDYRLLLQRSQRSGYRIEEFSCTPAENHTGFEKMCSYQKNGEQFMNELTSYCPLVGKPLSEALVWEPTTSPAGCLCTRASQDHKWRIVLQAIHFALNRPA